MSEIDREHADITIQSKLIGTWQDLAKMTRLRRTRKVTLPKILQRVVAGGATCSDTNTAKNLMHDNYARLSNTEIDDLTIVWRSSHPGSPLVGLKLAISPAALLHPYSVLLARSPQHKCQALILPRARSDCYHHKRALSRLGVRLCKLRESRIVLSTHPAS